jgi:hypothetical protein
MAFLEMSTWNGNLLTDVCICGGGGGGGGVESWVTWVILYLNIHAHIGHYSAFWAIAGMQFYLAEFVKM